MGPPRHGVLSGVVLPIGVPIRVNSVVSRVLYMGHNQPLEALHACLSSGLRANIHSSLSRWEPGTGTVHGGSLQASGNRCLQDGGAINVREHLGQLVRTASHCRPWDASGSYVGASYGSCACLL